MEHFDYSNVGINQETIGFAEGFGLGLVDKAIDPVQAQELEDNRVDSINAIEGERLTTKQQILSDTQEKTTILAAELSETSIDSSEYFGVQDAVEDMKEKFRLNGLPLDIDQYIDGFQDYIENKLNDSNPVTLSKIILSIQIRILSLGTEIDKIIKKTKKEIRKKGGDEDNLSGQRWIIAGKIQDVFKEVTNKILPSAFLVQEYDKVEDSIAFVDHVVNSFDYKEYTFKPTRSDILVLKSNTKDFNYEEYMTRVTEEDPNPSVLFTVEMQKDIATMQFRRNIDESREMLDKDIHPKSGKFHEFGWNYVAQANTLQINRKVHEKRFQAIGGNASSLKEISLLNETDKKIEKESMLLLMGGIAAHIAIEAGPAVLASVVPGAGTAAGAIVGSLLGAGIDIADTFSSKDAILELLKKAGVVKEEFDIEKGLLDNIMAGAGLIPGMTVATKSAKLASLMAKFGVSGAEVTKSMEKVAPLLKGGKITEAKPGLKASMKPDELKAYNDEISAAYTIVDGKRVSTGVAPKDVQDANALLSPPARRAKTDALLGEKLSDELHQAILDIHNMKVEDIINSGNEGKTAEELTQILNIRKGIKLRKAGLEENQVRILMDQKITGLPDVQVNDIELGVLSRMTYEDNYMLKVLQKYPDFGKLIASFGEDGGDIGKVVSDMTLSDDAILNFSSESSELIIMLNEKDIGKINDFLASHGKKLPNNIDLSDLKEYDEVRLMDTELSSLIDLLREIKLGKGDEVVDTIASKGDKVVDIVADTKKIDGFGVIEVNHPDIFAIHQAIEAGKNFGGLLARIDFKIEGVYDALDYLMNNTHTLITPKQLESIARFMKKDVEDISFNLDFTDGTAGITGEFLKGIFRIQEEIKTGIKISDNPFDMRIQDLVRLSKEKFGEVGLEVSKYIEKNPKLQKSAESLKNADYTDPDVLKNHVFEMGLFYEKFGEEALIKLFRDIFKSEDINIDKIIVNIQRYDEAVEIAASNKLKNLNKVLTSIGISDNEITGSMRQAVYLLEKLDKGSSSDIAYFIGRNHAISHMVTSLGNDTFLELLEKLNIDIASSEQGEFFKIIESLSV